jgi:hypothetical protein
MLGMEDNAAEMRLLCEEVKPHGPQ